MNAALNHPVWKDSDVSGGFCSDRHQHRSEQGESDADRADQQVFPHRLQRAVGAVKTDQRSADQCCRFDCNPEKPEIAGGDDQCHGGKKREHTGDEHRVPLESCGLVRMTFRRPVRGKPHQSVETHKQKQQ